MNPWGDVFRKLKNVLRRHGRTDQWKVAAKRPRDIGQDGGIVGSGHAERGVFRDHRPGNVAEVADLGGRESGGFDAMVVCVAQSGI